MSDLEDAAAKISPLRVNRPAAMLDDKIYVESFRGADQPRRILEEAQAMVEAALAVSERSGQ